MGSNLDWGQDLKKLKRYLDKHGVNNVCLAYFGTADPSYYGIRFEPLEDPEGAASGCVLAASATVLQDLFVAPGRFAWLRQQTPAARLGYSIYVYDLRPRAAGGAVQPSFQGLR